MCPVGASATRPAAESTIPRVEDRGLAGVTQRLSELSSLLDSQSPQAGVLPRVGCGAGAFDENTLDAGQSANRPGEFHQVFALGRRAAESDHAAVDGRLQVVEAGVTLPQALDGPFQA